MKGSIFRAIKFDAVILGGGFIPLYSKDKTTLTASFQENLFNTRDE